MIIQNNKKAKTITFTVAGELPYYKYETVSYAQAKKIARNILAKVGKK